MGFPPKKIDVRPKTAEKHNHTHAHRGKQKKLLLVATNEQGACVAMSMSGRYGVSWYGVFSTPEPSPNDNDAASCSWPQKRRMIASDAVLFVSLRD